MTELGYEPGRCEHQNSCLYQKTILQMTVSSVHGRKYAINCEIGFFPVIVERLQQHPGSPQFNLGIILGN